MKIKVGSQFSGVGAFNQAIERLGITYLDVYAAEWDKYARETFLMNFKEPEYYINDVYDTPIGEITDKYGSLDIAMFSPPCQAFSMAGKRLGKDDPEGKGILFFESLRFIEENKPKYFIFENVKGLLSHDKKNKKSKYGNTFSEWVNLLGGISINGNAIMHPYPGSVPYHIHYEVLNAKDYNIPQNRERVFIVGIRHDLPNKFSWPKKLKLEKRLKDVLEQNVNEKYYLSEKMIAYRNSNKKGAGGNDRTVDEIDENTEYSPCIISTYWKMAKDAPMVKEPQVGAIRGRDVNGEFVQQLEVNKENISNSLTTVTKDNMVIEPSIIQVNQSKESGGKQPYQQNRVYDTNGISPALCQGKSDLNIIEPSLQLAATLHGGKWDKTHEQSRRVYDANGISPCIHAFGGGNQEIKIAIHNVNSTNKSLAKTIDCNEIANTCIMNTYNKSINEEVSHAITTRVDASNNTFLAEMNAEQIRIRKLTPKECFRLMDFNEDFIEKTINSKLVSPSQLYKQAGNSICVGVLAGIIKNLIQNE